MAKASESGVWDQDPPGNSRAGSMFVKQIPNLKQVAKAKVVRDDWDDDDDDDDDEEQERDVEGEGECDGNANAKASGTTRNDGPDPGLCPSGRREREGEGRKGEEESSKIWEEANKKAPMPELIVAPTSTSQSFPPPPPAAFQPTLRILKRPSPNISANNAGAVSSASLSSSSPGATSGSGSVSGSPAPRGTLAEREAQYQEARSRIFGEKEKPGSTSGNASSMSMSMSRRSSSSGGVVVVRDPLGPASEPELDGQDKAHGPDRPAKGFGERRKKY